ncbi:MULTISPECIES: hypothetical protein [unclassified Methanosarcina]|uniref:hypothetical protein n=1 Tax=unclassified Methanosarcina TaxID=2644672 RepID=UPI00064FF31C|nr:MULTISPECIES: hypothetical protein [unclassified Methanosarcina]
MFKNKNFLKNVEEEIPDLPQKFRAPLSGEKNWKDSRVENSILSSKFQTPCCPVKIRKKFPSVMVYGIISPNYAVNTCQHADMSYNKKGKVPGTGERNSFTGIVLQKSGIYILKDRETSDVSQGTTTERKSFTKAKPEHPRPYKSGKLQIRNVKDLFV